MNFERLKGRENYQLWKRSMLAFLRTKKLAKCVTEPNTEDDEDKLAEAMGWLVLATEQNVASHFKDNDSPIQLWKLLNRLFAESGIDREVTALIDLTNIKLSYCPSVDEYIGKTMEAWSRCTEAKVDISDRVVALLMLGKLGPQYQPFLWAWLQVALKSRLTM